MMFPSLASTLLQSSFKSENSDREICPEQVKLFKQEYVLKSIFDKTTVVLNVGGIKHQISWNKLEKVAGSRLYRIRFAKDIDEIEQLCDGYDIFHNEIFFDRPARHFSFILNFYQTGKLHLMDDGCVLAIFDDLNYWGKVLACGDSFLNWH